MSWISKGGVDLLEDSLGVGRLLGHVWHLQPLGSFGSIENTMLLPPLTVDIGLLLISIGIVNIWVTKHSEL